MQDKQLEEFTNSLSSVVQNVSMQGAFNAAQVSQGDTMARNLRYYMLSNNRMLLSQLYVEHGIIQTLVDQPVDDAFRSGFEVKTDALDADDKEKLAHFLKRHGVTKSVVQAIKWARLFGGGAVLLITDQPSETEFDPTKVTEKTRIEFRAVDMWELYFEEQNQEGQLDPDTRQHYNYYSKKVHRSRVFPIKGKEPPSPARSRLRGWGMSELERTVRSVNTYMKNQDVVFDLLDEAKIDVFGINGFTDALSNTAGSDKVTKRIQLANMLKNHQNALVMDKEDTYEQKQMAFAGLADMMNEFRLSVASDLKMPVTKLFGMSAAGFNSGEDDIENYNSMVESEVREKVEYLLLDIICIVCQKLFGVFPDDMEIVFNPLRIMSAEQEENIKEKKFNRVLQTWQEGLFANASEFKEAVNKDSLLPIELDEKAETQDFED